MGVFTQVEMQVGCGGRAVSLEQIKCTVDRLIDVQSFQDPPEPQLKSPSSSSSSHPSLPLMLPQIPIFVRQPLF
jgi:hypothetical protein